MCEILLECESFSDLGGWTIDCQSMETIHSSYLMAHGMGIPVQDASTKFEVPKTGDYFVWALTRDWTAVWNVRDSAGKFKIAIDYANLSSVLGTNSEKWSWQLAGTCSLQQGPHVISLHDLTGFNGRCDCIYLTTERDVPADNIVFLDALRQRLNWKTIREDSHVYDLIVVGGGVAGICTALSALRGGADTILLHSQDVLGGCNSSEIRVCMGGMANLQPYENIGNVVKEIAPIMGSPFVFKPEYYEDNRKRFAFEVSEKADALALRQCVTDITMEHGKIVSVVATDTHTGKKTRYRAKLFSDCSGDAVLSRLAGAQTMYGREGRNLFGETLAPTEPEKLVMGHSIRWYSEKSTENTDFPDINWGLKFDDETCLNVLNGDWEQETGFGLDMVKDIEYIRDFGLRAIYSNWSYQKHHYKNREKYKDYALQWVSAIGGKRESYRVVGDYVLAQNDIEGHHMPEDATACMTWSIDMHFAECDNAEAFQEPFRSYAYHRGIGTPCPVPYRCLYAKDVPNLFLGGRIVSASHIAFSSIRVMRTLGQLGEVVGLAVNICLEKNCLPRDIYTDYLLLLQEKMKKGVSIPSAFCCSVDEQESYHFKDIGWLHLNPYSCDETHIEKFKRGIQNLGIEHKYPLPDKLKTK